jgi:hypothetical protein
MQYSKSEAGQQAFKARSELFSARQRSAFILFDGVKTTAQVLAATAGLGITLDDIDYLVKQGFLEASLVNLPSPVSATSIETVSVDEAPKDSVSTRSPQERYRDAMPFATKVTASLGLRGFRLNLAVEAASGYEDLLALLPKIQALAGEKACIEFERALKG